MHVVALRFVLNNCLIERPDMICADTQKVILCQIVWTTHDIAKHNETDTMYGETLYPVMTSKSQALHRCRGWSGDGVVFFFLGGGGVDRVGGL